MAERVVDRVAKQLEEEYDKHTGKCSTDTIPLIGSTFKNYKAVKRYIKEVRSRLEPFGFGAYDAWYLVTTYGTQTEIILERFDTLTDTHAGDDIYARLAKAEYSFVVRYEMVHTPMDFFIRRTGRLYFHIESIQQLLEPVLEEHQRMFGVNDSTIEIYRKELVNEVKRHSQIGVERIGV